MAVAVISRDDIRKYNYRTLVDALASVPGIFASNDHGYDDFCIIGGQGKRLGSPRNFNLLITAWYVNHSHSPNLVCKDYQFFAARDIAEGEELTVDYHTFNDFGELPPYMRPSAGSKT